MLEYFDIGHSLNQNNILWIYDHVIKWGWDKDKEYHYKYWKQGYTSWGRIDTDKKIGSIILDSEIQQKESRKIVEEVIIEFPGIKFYVFDLCELFGGISVQQFWEDTE